MYFIKYTIYAWIREYRIKKEGRKVKMFLKSFLVMVSIIVGFSIVGCSNEKIEGKEGSSVTVSNKESNSTTDNIDWKVSEIFKSENLSMLGVKNRLGFSYSDEHSRFYPNNGEKYGWHFWGSEEELKGKLTVKGTHKETGKEIVILKDITLKGPNDGADRHTPSTMSLPDSGMWKLDAFIDEKLFGSVFVKVYER